ncbi:MAG: Asp-tRNA(Asn)/Glu-tRNA(Gln) amidotransferase subunit GatC [Candidatus Omnitrophica bacterium]|nr:Asp-tRNA(Asn)/Glu-tRNA(Gln) amidotransferase subunit GatC [Candidatus Omnitrophota bacterium]
MSHIDLRYTSHLARLGFKPEELKVFGPQVDKILHFVEQLNKVDVEGVEPTSHPLPLANVFREDKIAPSIEMEEFLQHCPSRHGSFFKVPKIIEEKS